MSHLRGHIGYFANVFLECVLFMFFWYVAPMWEYIYISREKREVNDVKGFYLILYSLALDIYYFFWQ